MSERATRVGYYVHHHGAGHLTRAVEIARHCRHEITGLSSLPRPEGWRGPWIELPRDDIPADPAAPSWPDPDAGGVLHWAPAGPGGYQDRMAVLAGWLTRVRPELLVVDVSVEVALLARLLGVPVAVAAMRGDRTDRAHRAAYDVAGLLLAPWPADSPEPSISAERRAKTVHTGGISRFDDRIAPATEPRPAGATRVVSVLWGRGGGRWAPQQQAQVAAATPGWRWEDAGADGDVWTSLRGADVVVTHAGQNAVAEVAAARRPAVVVALARPHDEQIATVDALAASDLAETSVGLPEAHLWPDLLERAVRRDGDDWSRWSDGHGGARAARAVEAHVAGRRLAERTAVITLVQGRHDHLRGLLAGLAQGTHLPERVVVVALGDPDVAAICAESRLEVDVVDIDVTGDLPLAKARNIGAGRATELGCRTLVFLDVDCIPSPALVGTYAEHVATGETPQIWGGTVAYLPPPDPGGYDLDTLDSLAEPHPARPVPAAGEVLPGEDLRLFWSLSFAMSAADFAALGGFDERYVGYGGEDTDFAMRLDAAGGRLWWVGGASAFHQHHPVEAPPTRHLHDIVRNANLFAERWGWHPMQGWLDGFAAAGLARFDDAERRWHVTESAQIDAPAAALTEAPAP